MEMMHLLPAATFRLLEHLLILMIKSEKALGIEVHCIQWIITLMLTTRVGPDHSMHVSFLILHRLVCYIHIQIDVLHTPDIEYSK